MRSCTMFSIATPTLRIISLYSGSLRFLTPFAQDLKEPERMIGKPKSPIDVRVVKPRSDTLLKKRRDRDTFIPVLLVPCIGFFMRIRIALSTYSSPSSYAIEPALPLKSFNAPTIASTRLAYTGFTLPSGPSVAISISICRAPAGPDVDDTSINLSTNADASPSLPWNGMRIVSTRDAVSLRPVGFIAVMSYSNCLFFVSNATIPALPSLPTVM